MPVSRTRCASSDIDYLVVAEDRIPWGHLNVVDLGSAGYRIIPPDTRPLACGDIAIGDLVEIDGRNIYRSGPVTAKGGNLHPDDGDYFPCMVIATSRWRSATRVARSSSEGSRPVSRVAVSGRSGSRPWPRAWRSWAWSSARLPTADSCRPGDSPEDALLLDPSEPVDLGDEPVGHPLEEGGLAADVVRADQALRIPGTDLGERLVPQGPDLDAGLLHALVDEVDQLAAALFGHRRYIESNGRSVDRWRQADLL